MKKHNSFLSFIGWMIAAFLTQVSFSDPVSSLKSPIFTGIEADTAGTILRNEETLDSATMELQSLYSKWRNISRCFFFSMDKVLLHEYSALPAELNERIAIYKIVFPGIVIDSAAVYNEIVIEKYLSGEKNIAPSPLQIEAVYNEFKSQYPTSPHPDQKTIYPLLRNQALFSMDTVVSMQNEVLNTDRKRRAKNKEPWSIEEIAINTEPHHCLVTNPENGECLVSVEEFNAFALIEPVRRLIRLDSARSMLLNNLLKSHYFSSKMNKHSMQNKKAFVENLMEWMEMKSFHLWHPDINQYNEQLFINTYNKYYNRFFCDRTIKKIGIIGSTDSLYIDSLYKDLLKTETDTGIEKASRKHALLKSLPWVVTSSKELPDTIVSSINSLRSQQYKTCSSPFGFFLVRIIENRQQQRILLEDAREKLIYLIHEDSARSGGKPDSIRALDYYKKYDKKFKTPDTILARAWLVPLIDSSTFTAMGKNEQRKRIAKDTSTYVSAYIRSSDLPATISDRLIEYYKSNDHTENLIGPVSSIFGTWYFFVDKVNTGGKTIPFALVKDSILKELEVQSFPFEKIAKTKTGKQLLENEAFARAYHSNIPKEIESLTVKDIQRLIDTINISYADNVKIDTGSKGFSKQKLLEMILKRDRINSAKWVGTLSINRTLLFTGCSQYVDYLKEHQN